MEVRVDIVTAKTYTVVLTEQERDKFLDEWRSTGYKMDTVDAVAIGLTYPGDPNAIRRDLGIGTYDQQIYPHTTNPQNPASPNKEGK